jgi:hypothetical protein
MQTSPPKRVADRVIKVGGVLQGLNRMRYQVCNILIQLGKKAEQSRKANVWMGACMGGWERVGWQEDGLGRCPA